MRPLCPARDNHILCVVKYCPCPVCNCSLQRAAELQSARSNVAASADAEQSRLLGLVSAQAAALADKERQLEVRATGHCGSLDSD